MRHAIPEHATNTEVNALIDEYVRLERDRDILRDHWFKGMSFMKLSEEYDLSLTAIKTIIYKQGDRVLLRLK